MISWLPLLAIAAVFYFFIIRPQNRRTKLQREFIENLSKGQEVITNGGIHGRIAKVDDTTISLQVDSKTFITLEKGSVSQELTATIDSNEQTS